MLCYTCSNIVFLYPYGSSSNGFCQTKKQQTILVVKIFLFVVAICHLSRNLLLDDQRMQRTWLTCNNRSPVSTCKYHRSLPALSDAQPVVNGAHFVFNSTNLAVNDVHVHAAVAGDSLTLNEHS